MAKEKLFKDFNPTSTKTWEEKINKDLKGADYNKRLITKTIEGIDIKPYYRKEDLIGLEYLSMNPGDFPYVRTNNKFNNFHEIRQDIIVEDFNTANKKAVDALSKGATSIGFDLQKYNALNFRELSTLLNTVDIERYEINFLNGKLSVEIVKHYIKYISENNYKQEAIRGSIDFDPLGYKSITGECFVDNNNSCEYNDYIKVLFDLVQDKIPNFRILAVNGQYFRNAGSSAVQEIAMSLAIGSDYLEKSQKAGITTDEIAPKMKFNFGIASNYFIEIAKIRAGRLLWAKIVEAYGVNEESKCDMYIHSVTCDWNKTAYDPYVNVLRTTTEAMSAVLGGTDSLTVNPFDSSFEKPDELAERVARNTQIILKEEAYFNQAVDPSGGSYYIESLTNSIAEHAWNLFVEIENEGGYHKAFDKGIIKNKIEEVALQRDMNIAQRREILLGTNQYPNQNEKIRITNHKKPVFPQNALKLYRGAEAFEEIRQKTENASKRPRVFLLTIGNLAMRKARATFSANFFACAGFEILENPGFLTVEEAVNAVIESEADITVICSSDDEYPDIAPSVYQMLKNKSIVVIAGYPENSVNALKDFGINHFIHVKSNVLDTLKDFQNLLGI